MSGSFRSSLPPVLVLLLCCAAPARLQAQQPSSPAQLVARGDALLSQGQSEAAEDAYRQAIEQDGEETAAYLGLARVALAAERWRDAGDWLDQVLLRDPENVEAHYHRAISHREVAKYNSLLGIRDWKQATYHFEWVLERDSLYRDVLHQFAQLRRYGKDYEEALALGHEQIRRKPELAEPRQELLRTYGYFIRNTDPKEIRSWLAAHPSAYSTYSEGELLRREGQLREAEALFEKVLERAGTMPAQPILLSLARVHYALEQPEQAQAFVEEAVRRIESPMEADLVFEDFKYLFNDAEMAQYRKLRRPEEHRAFFHAFWTRRNPVPASLVNARLAEHYRRLLKAEQEYAYDGLRTWSNNPDKAGEFRLPEVYHLNEVFNDKGLIYLRHGEPDDRIVTVTGEVDFFRGQTSSENQPGWLPKEESFQAGWTPNESWRYHSPQMDFHFVIDEGAGANNWRLTPVLTNYEMLQDREFWGGTYARLAAVARRDKENRNPTESDLGGRIEDLTPAPEGQVTGGEGSVEESGGGAVAAPRNVTGYGPDRRGRLTALDLSMIRTQMVEASQKAIELGLSTDRHTWAEEVEPLEVPHFVAAFQGEDGKTQVEIHFALPIGQLTHELGMGIRTVDVEVGCAAFGDDWRAAAEMVRVKNMPPVPDRDAAVLDYCPLTLSPETYQLAFHSDPVASAKLGGYKFEYDVPSFSGTGLSMSDLLPASSIKPTLGPSRFSRGELYITANPFLRFSVRQPMYLYFEVYNLTYDADDQTRYEVAYTLTPVEQKRSAFRLFGRRDQPGLSLQMERTGSERSPKEYSEIDISEVDPGSYTLTVRVTNLMTGDSVERVRPIELVE